MIGTSKNIWGFDPRSVPGCQLWLDAVDPAGTGVVPINEGVVSTWVDKSGNGRNVSATGSPVITTDNNGLKHISFNGSSYFTTNFTALSGVSYVSWIAVANVTNAASANYGTIVGTSYASNNYAQNQLYVNQGNLMIFFRRVSGAANYNTTVALSSGRNILQSITNYTNGNYQLYQNGVASTLQTNGPTSAIASETVNLTIGYDLYPGETILTGTISEILLYTQPLTTDQRQQIEGYLANKWGLTTPIPLTHPFKSIRPHLRTFQPADIPGCSLWLDGADTSSLTLSGSNVTAWSDKSGNGHLFTGTGAVISNIVSSTNTSLYFNGSGYLSYNSLSITNPYTIFTVAYQSINNNSYQRILNGVGPTGNDFLIAMGAVGSNVATFLGFGGNWNDAGANIPLTQSLLTTNIICSTVSVGTITTHVNGITLDSKTGSTNPNFTGLNIAGGWGTMANAGYQTWTGHVCEIIHYPGIIDTTQRQRVEGYLAHKWGLTTPIPSTHPFKSILPATTAHFSPTSITGCQLWLDAADPAGTSVTPSNGATVSTWVDKSGNVNDGTSGTATFQTDSLGGYINFTGSQYYSITNPNIVVNQYFTVFVVEQIGSVPLSSVYALMGGVNGTNENLHIVYRNNTPVITFAFYYNDINVNVSSYGYGTGGAQPTRLWTFSFIANSRNIYLNGTSIGSDTNNTFLSGWAGARIASAFSSEYYIGKMREIIIYSGTITTNQRQQVEGYLAHKWGLTNSLPSKHPYKPSPPIFPPNLFFPTPSMYSVLFNSGSLSVPANAALTLGTNNHTFEFWLYQTSRNFYDCPFMYGNTAGNATNNYYMNLGQYTGVLIGNGSPGGWSLNMANGLSLPALNTWSHYALVRNGNTFTLYLNGTNVASATLSISIPAQGGVMAIGGLNSSGNTISGYMTNFRFVNGTAVYTSNFTPPTTPLTAIPNTQVLIQGLVDRGPNAFTVTNNGGVTLSTSVSPF